MATRRWRGNAPEVAQVTTVRIHHIADGVVVTLTNGGKTVTATADDEDTTTSIMQALAEAWTDAIEPQFTEITAEASGETIVLTANEPGVPFDITPTQSGTGGDGEVKTVTINNSPTGGTWSWVDATYGTVSGIAYNASAGTLQTALEGIYGSGNVSVSGSSGGPYTVTFQGSKAHLDIPDTTFTNTSLTGGNATVTVDETTKGAAGTSEVQTITFYGSPSGGTWTATFNGYTTTALAHNISTANLQTALRALASIGASGVTVGGSAGAWVVTFAGTLANTAVPMITVDTTSLTGGSIYGTIATSTPGVDGLNEIQLLCLVQPGSTNERLALEKSGTVSGGTFRFKHTMTGTDTYSDPIAYDAKLYEVCEALEALIQEVLPVTYAGPYFSPFHEGYANLTIPACHAIDARSAALEMIGNYGGANVTFSSSSGGGTAGIGLLAIDSASLTGGGSYSFPGSTGSWNGLAAGSAPTTGTFALTFGGYTTETFTLAVASDVVTSPTAAAVQAALELLPSIGTGNVSVTGLYDDLQFAPPPLGSSRGLFRVQFQGALAGVPVAQISGCTVYTFQNGVAGTSEVQTVTLSGSPSTGTFTLTYDGAETAPIAYDAAAATVDAALEALSTIPAGGVTCTGGALPGSAVTVTFSGALQYTNVSQLIINDSGLKHSVVETTPGVTTANEVQTISLSGSPHGGTATLTYDGQTTAGIAYNASAGTIQTALIALSNLASGDVVCTGGPWPAAVTVTFGATLANTDVVAITGSGSSLNNGAVTSTSVEPMTATVTTANSGPNDWEVALNWSGDTVPVTGDTVVIDQGSIPILYHLDQTDVILADLKIAARYLGTIGLAERNTNGQSPYFEYRQAYLKIGAALATVGYGEGQGSGRIKLDLTPSTTPTVTVSCTANPLDDGTKACLLLTPAGTVLNVTRGSVGVAIYAGETSTVVTTRVGFQTNAAGDVDLEFGSGVTWTTIDQSGGKIVTNSAGTTLTKTDGDFTHNAGALTTATVDGGTLRYNSTGTLTTAKVGSGGSLDFRQNMSAKTVTNLELYAGSEWHDPYGVVTVTNGYDFVRCQPSDCIFEVKPHQTWTPSSI